MHFAQNVIRLTSESALSRPILIKALSMSLGSHRDVVIGKVFRCGIKCLALRGELTRVTDSSDDPLFSLSIEKQQQQKKQKHKTCLLI